MVEGARLEIVLPSTGYQGSNPCLSAKKFHRNRDGIFLSKPQAWHIITRQRAYHQPRQKIILPLLYIITHTRVLRISLRLDDIQGFALMICNTSC